MNLKCLKNKLIELNEEGIPLPLIRDPHINAGSFPLTMMFISFNVCLLALIGKLDGKLGGVDYNNALWLFSICGGFYLGRKIQGDGKSIAISSDDNKQESKE